MKKLLLTLILGLGLTNFASASHMMGGQITVEHISGMDYRVVYTAYRDMTGIPIAQVASISFVDSVSGTSFIVPIHYDTLVTVLVPGVEEYVYDTVVTFPNAGSWYISYEECCRNAAILNMTNPSGESHHFYSIVLIDSTNSTPVFLNPPIVMAQENVPFYYNPLPFDFDGDSIAWSLDVPLSSNGVPVAGYVLPSSDSLVPFNMDPITGEITFLPNMLGHFQVSVRVKEYRNGVQIGEITRDMQLIVVQSLNVPAVLMISSNSAPFNGKSYTIAPNASFSMNVTIFDQDNQGLILAGRGEAFSLTSNPAMLSVVNGVSSATATISWTPNSTQARTAPYVIGLRVSENYGNMVFQSDVSVSLRVGLGVTGINENSNDAQLSLSPNPAADQFNIQFVSKSNSDVAIDVMTIDGKSTAQFINTEIAAGLNVIQVNNLHLAKGIYIVRLNQDGKSLGMQRLVIQ
ncbi:MAG: T9SS type A sorting domain-containing protein [Bacteroidetes bacterium]|nr:T9SS type A sorting domain-containing protein [Bacteroidota bacterium]